MNRQHSITGMETLLFTSGKGGAGCSTIAAALATIAAERGIPTLLVELSAYCSSQSMFANSATATDSYTETTGLQAPVTIRPSLDLIWGPRFESNCANELDTLLATERRRARYRLVILDVAAGEPESDRRIAALSTHAILVGLPELNSIAANFGLFKNLAGGSIGRISLLLNRVTDDTEATDLSQRFSTLCEQFVGRIPEASFSLPTDAHVTNAQSLQKTVLTGAIRSAFARRVERLADRLLERSLENGPTSAEFSQPRTTGRLFRPRNINMKHNLADIKD